jgi:hypothetical protein
MAKSYQVHHWCNACGNRWDVVIGEIDKKKKKRVKA